MEGWLEPFLGRMRRKAQRHWAPFYLKGLILPGEGTVGIVWPAPSASDFVRSVLIRLRQRIRSQGQALAKMEIRAPWSS